MVKIFDHTDENWAIGKSYVEGVLAIRIDGDADRDCIAEVLIIDDDVDEAHSRASAMAAAPKLLAALKRIMRESPEVPAGINLSSDSMWVEAARAIAKAECKKYP